MGPSQNPDLMNQAPIAKAEMLIRKPVSEVFNAFTDPATTSKFWFTKSSGKLEAGKRVRWEWEMYGVSSPVTVKAIEPNKRIVIEWSEPATTEPDAVTISANGSIPLPPMPQKK